MNYSAETYAIIAAVIAIASILLFYGVVFYTHKTITQPKKLTSLKEFFDNADTGDLVFMSGNSRGERVCKWFSDSPFSHVSLVIKEEVFSENSSSESELYLWETDLGQKTKDGPRIIKLKDKLELYKGDKIVGWKSLSSSLLPRPTSEKIMEVVKEYKSLDFDDTMIRWILGRLASQSDKVVFCSELIALTLQHPKINILNDDIPAHSYSPGSFEKKSINQSLKKGYSYNDMKYIHR